jgi:ribosomal subunit interface protein
MEVRMTSRRSTLPKALRDRTQELLSKLSKFGALISVVEVIFDEEKNSKKIEGILHIDRRDPIVATGRGNDFNEVLSQVSDRLGRQFRKLQKQVTDYRAPSLTEALSEE